MILRIAWHLKSKNFNMKNYFKILPILFLSLFIISCDDNNDDECDFSRINSAPVITNNSDEYIIMKENQTYAFTVNANDVDGDDLNFEINGQDDGGEYTSDSTFFNATYLITIDKWTGVVTFNEAPDYENPQDIDRDNIYRITITVEDGDGNYCSANGVLSTTKTFEIKVIK